MTSQLVKFYPEARFGGFSDVDGTIAFYSRISSLLAQSSVVVDFGCGRGSGDEDSVQFRKNLRNFRGRVSQVIGLDVDIAGSDNQFVDEFRLLAPGAAWPVRAESVDLLYGDFVLEHLPEPGTFFREAHRVLKPGGYLCLRTPNALGYVGLVSALLPGSLHKALLRRAQPDRREEDVFPTFYRCNTLWALRRELRAKGFKGVVYGYDAEPSYLSFSPVAYWLGTVYSRLAPPMFRSCLFAFAQKAAAL
jgi:SAM-dependent methyltransferase